MFMKRAGVGLGLGLLFGVVGTKYIGSKDGMSSTLLSFPFFGNAGRIESKEARDIASITIAAESRLPLLESSQTSKVIRVEKFLSREEIKQILEYAEANKNEFGRRKRDAKGVIKYKDDYTWETLFLHSDGKFQSQFPLILERIKNLIAKVDTSYKWNLLIPPSTSASSNIINSSSIIINTRTIEIHEVLPNGGLPDRKHFDGGSLITVDIMLSDPENGDFTGADFATLESGNCSSSSESPYLQKHSFNQGDALVFQSHKFHCIQPLKSGRRKVLVLEFWEGDERTCAHRCTKRSGQCRFSRVEGEIDALMQNLSEDI